MGQPDDDEAEALERHISEYQLLEFMAQVHSEVTGDTLEKSMDSTREYLASPRVQALREDTRRRRDQRTKKAG